jgi:hypothetical protein
MLILKVLEFGSYKDDSDFRGLTNHLNSMMTMQKMIIFCIILKEYIDVHLLKSVSFLFIF